MFDINEFIPFFTRLLKEVFQENVDLEDCMQYSYIKNWISSFRIDYRISPYKDDQVGSITYEMYENDVSEDTNIEEYMEKAEGAPYIEHMLDTSDKLGLDAFRLTPEEIDMLLTIHELVVNDILSLTYPLEVFE